MLPGNVDKDVTLAVVSPGLHPKVRAVLDRIQGDKIHGCVNLSCLGLTRLPDLSRIEVVDLDFSSIGPINYGDFYCEGNGLTSLRGCPWKVRGNFFCTNNRLRSLKGAPIEVGGSIWCGHNPLVSLDGLPPQAHGSHVYIDGPRRWSENEINAAREASLRTAGGLSETQDPIAPDDWRNWESFCTGVDDDELRNLTWANNHGELQNMVALRFVFPTAAEVHRFLKRTRNRYDGGAASMSLSSLGDPERHRKAWLLVDEHEWQDAQRSSGGLGEAIHALLRA